MNPTEGTSPKRTTDGTRAAPYRTTFRIFGNPKATMLWSAIGIVIALVIPPVLPPYLLHLVILSLLYACLTAAVDFLLGTAGLASFGHAALFGSAAYTVAILTTKTSTSLGVAALAGIGVAAVVAALFGLLVSHLRGDSFLLSTLALGMVVWGGAYRWVSMTGGDNGLPGVPRPDLFGGEWPNVAMYYLVAVFFALLTWAIWALRRSPLGYTLYGIRENETRLSSLGYNVWLHKFLAVIISGLIAGVGGVLYALYNGFVSPVDVHLDTSVQSVLMAVLGGTGTVLGPVIGSVVVVVVRDLLSAYTERWTLILGALYVVAMLYAPFGLLGLLRRRRARRVREVQEGRTRA